MAVALAWLVAGVVPPAGAQARPVREAGPSDLGVALALSGEAARAESVFVSMLSHTRGDSRALNNLGNLRLLRGDLGVALAFYDRALKADSTDAGIHLNRATTLMLMGDDARARLAAAEGVRLAGGVNAAQEMLGISPDPAERAGTTEQRAADQRAFVNRGEIRALLQSAAAAVPRDTTRAGGTGAGAATTRRRAPTWRSAGPRASDQSDAANILYWKR
jgi:tetratricopeptide (TPR) repeat protein